MVVCVAQVSWEELLMVVCVAQVSWGRAIDGRLCCAGFLGKNY